MSNLCTTCVEMALYSNLEYTHIVVACNETWGNGARAQRIFSGSLPNRLSNVLTVRNVVQHIREYGSFNLATQNRGRLGSNRIDNSEEASLEKVKARPGTSTHHLTVMYVRCIGE